MTNTYLDSYNDGQLVYRLCSNTVASPGIFLRKEHNLTVNERVQFDTDGTMPTGISRDTWYFVISGGLTSDEFEVSATKGGSAVNITVAGSGQLYFASDRPIRMMTTQESNQ